MKNKKYSYLIKIKCENPKCGKEFNKYVGEYNRSVRLGRKQYCCLSCYGKTEGIKALKNIPEEIKERTQKNFIGKYKHLVGNKGNKYTRFRFFMRRIQLNNIIKKLVPQTNIDLDYLMDLWKKQNGICPFTGWKLKLPKNVGSWKSRNRRSHRASLDRIDNSKGYVKGNVRFVSLMANYARNSMSDAEVIEFCKAVANHRI